MYAGKSEQMILRKLQHLSSKQSRMEKRHGAANRLPAGAGGGVSDPTAGDTTDDEIIIPSFKLNTQEAPPTPVSVPASSTPVRTPVQRVVQVSKPLGVSHSAPELRDRPRTVPNILCRRKNPAPPASSLAKTVEGKTEDLQIY